MTRHNFKGALAALAWLRENGFQMGANLSDAWIANGQKAYVLDTDRGVTVTVDSGHAPATCSRSDAQYSFRNWIYKHTCPTCGRKGKFNQNFLGQRKVVCDGIKFHKVET